MTMRILSALVALSLTAAPPASAQRLTLNFLPPDLPPGNACNAETERFDDDETQVADDGSGPKMLDDTGRLQFLASDIRNLQRADANGGFDFIMALISRRAELDPAYAGVEEAFDRVDTYLLAGRPDELSGTGLVETLARGIDSLDWSDTVRLARFYRHGTGVPKDRDFAVRLITDKAFLGSANALMEVLQMQVRGEDVGDWTLPPEETARLAFGGLIGQQNRGLCARAERMAREYLGGDILTPNPSLAFAWRKFAADQGGAEAAWRVVEHYLNATGDGRDEAALRHYLQQAVAGGFVVEPGMVDEVVSSGASTEAEVRRILGFNHARSGRAERLSAERFMDLDARLTPKGVDADGEVLQYLREIAALPDPHPSVLTRLAREVILRKGRWAGRDEAMAILRTAVAKGDTDATMLLAELLLADRHDPAAVSEAETLLTDVIARHGYAPAMDALDRMYRCQLPGAPYLDEAAHWAEAYRASGVAPVSVSTNDLARLDARHEPEVIARLQRLAIDGHANSTAGWLQYLQSNAMTPDTVLRYWAGQTAHSNIALEAYALQQYDLALTPRERKSAAEFVRRAYLDIGPAIALEYALTLLEDSGRDPETAAQIQDVLEGAALRGEGAAIRLLQRLTGRDPVEVYTQHADAIEARGDFLAQMVAAPHLDDAAFRRAMDRAVSMMNCTTKDVTELADAYLARGLDVEALAWIRIGQALEGGNTLAKLGLSDGQMAAFDIGLSAAEDMARVPETDGDDYDIARQSFLETSDIRSERFDPDEAAANLVRLLNTRSRAQFLWALEHYRTANAVVRAGVDAKVDVRAGLERASANGDQEAQYHLGLLIRTDGTTPADLAASTDWLRQAAEAGHGGAMIEYAFAVGFGIGRPADPKWALTWLDRAETFAPGKASELRALLAAMVAQ